MDIESGVWIRSSSRLEPLRPLLKAWVEKSLAYCKCHNFEDNGWWYNERASLSILAAAAWSLKGWCALEEYSTEKRGNVPSDDMEVPDSRRGRADLWVGGRTGYAIEAKQAWQSIGARSSGNNSNVWDKFDKALKDAGDLTSDAADRRIGALFVAAHLPVSQVRVPKSGRIDRDQVAASVSAWFDALALKSHAKVRAYAWVFPTKMDKFISDTGKNLVPGSLLILGERGRANKRKS